MVLEVNSYLLVALVFDIQYTYNVSCLAATSKTIEYLEQVYNNMLNWGMEVSEALGNLI